MPRREIDFEPIEELEPQPPELDFEPIEAPVINEGGVSFGERAVIKNLIDDSPELQEKYLQSKGYDVRTVKGDLQVKKSTDSAWRKVDPEGFDIEDITDHIGDALQGIAAAAGAAFGSLAGPLGTVAGGATASAAAEAVKQGIGQAAGLRDEMSGTDIAIAGATGAIPGAIQGGIAMKAAAPKAVSTIARKVGLPESVVSRLAKVVSKGPVTKMAIKAAGKPKITMKGGQIVKKTPPKKPITTAVGGVLPSIRERLEGLE